MDHAPEFPDVQLLRFSFWGLPGMAGKALGPPKIAG